MKKIPVVLVLLLLAAFGGLLAWNWYTDNKKPNFDGSATLYIHPGDTPEDALRQIREQCNILDESSIERVFEAKKVADYITPGCYTITKNNSSVYVARMLNNGWQSPVRLTLSGNLRIKSNIAAKVASQLLIDSATFHKALDDKELLSKYGFTPQNVFSLLVPDTYDVYWTASAEDILDKQKKAYDAYWTDDNLAKAKKLGMTQQQVSTLASIVKGESNYAPEMPKIAGVYLNRLKLGMALQADPTVAFCFDYQPQRILKKHLEVESPYNTYKYAGLPPGPICVPTRESLDAVLNPDYGASAAGAKGCNLYFCANPDFSGTHVFAATLSAHNANAAAFQAEQTRRHRAKQK